MTAPHETNEVQAPARARNIALRILRALIALWIIAATAFYCIRIGAQVLRSAQPAAAETAAK